MLLSNSFGITASIYSQVKQSPDRPALDVDGQTWSYQELHLAALSLAQKLDTRGDPVTVAVMAGRGGAAFIGILAAMYSGLAYVPINVSHPAQRNLQVLQRSGARQIICGEAERECLQHILTVSPSLKEEIEIVHCQIDKVAGDVESLSPLSPRAVTEKDWAYVLFTSGSTGQPKGVPISHKNLRAYLNAVSGIMDVTKNDRFSQTFELTFDLSVHDMFVCWTNGAHLVVADRRALDYPADYLREKQITCWFSVPSLAYQIQLGGQLKSGAFPDLRWSLFCGEALPADLAFDWLNAAPNSRVENWYGPTEACIACSRYRVDEESEKRFEKGELLPIGIPFEGMEMLVCDEQLRDMPVGTAGELLLNGQQVAEGYLGDPEKTASAFVERPGSKDIFYRSGDRVSKEEDGTIRFLGRIDNQVKIRGFRVELGEIESVIRTLCPVTVNAIAMSWPPEKVSGNSIVVALESDVFDVQAILEGSKQLLPDYMVPSRIVCLSAFPKNASGKADRKAITEVLSKLFLQQASESKLQQYPEHVAALLRLVIKVAPNLDLPQLMQADNLIAAGMDSISFVNLTREIEQSYSVELAHELVASLAETPVEEMASILSRGQVAVDEQGNAKQASAQTGRINHRANRALQFIQRFPKMLTMKKKPFVLVVGSSGVFRGFSPAHYDLSARELGHDIVSVNIGLPALTAAGIARIGEFIKSNCLDAGVKVPVVIYELDPMLLSVLPPKGDIDLKENYFSESMILPGADKLDSEFSWRIKAAGAGQLDIPTTQNHKSPAWQKRRDIEIAHTFSGLVKFNDKAVDAWIKGAGALSNIAERILGFIHPVNNQLLESLSPEQGKEFSSLLKKLESDTRMKILDWQTFDLEDDDFLDFNHANAHGGRQKLSVQLAHKTLE
jgi:amino acid adenylation domain-containing protein